MTEDEAKTRWCPMFQVSAGMTGNDDVNNRAGNCIASDCMAWIETDRETRPTYLDGPSDFFPAGYCGLTSRR